MSKQMNERKETNQINIMKSEIIMKNYNRKKYKKTTRKNKINYLEWKLFKVHGLYFKFIAQRNIPILKYLLVIIPYVAVRESAFIKIIIDHNFF